MPGAIFLEGRRFFRGTFHTWRAFSRKVPVQVLLVCAILGHLERKTLVLLLVYTILGHLEQ